MRIIYTFAQSIFSFDHWSALFGTVFLMVACFSVSQAQETEVTLSGGILTITDINGGTSDDDWSMSFSGGTYTISDNTGSNPITTSISGATGDGTSTVTVPNTGVAGVSFQSLAGDDIITINSIDALTADLTVTGGGQTDYDWFFLNGNVSLSNNASVSITEVERIELNTNVSVTVTGTGTITMEANADDMANINGDYGRALFVANGAQLSAVNGDISLVGNQDGASPGITGLIIDGSVSTSGSGSIMIDGGGGVNEGVRLSASGSVSATGGGSITILSEDEIGNVGQFGTDILGSVTTNTGDIVINTVANDDPSVNIAAAISSTSGNINISGTSNNVFDEAITLSAGGDIASQSGTMTLTGIFTSNVGVQNGEMIRFSGGTVGNGSSTGAINLIADDIAYTSGLVQSSGPLAIAPQSGSTNINLPAATANNFVGLELDNATIAGLITPGFSSIAIGDNTNTGTITVDGIDFSTPSITSPVTLIGTTLTDADDAGTDMTATAITGDGNHSPGASPGILSVTGNYTFADNSTFTVEIDGNAGAGQTGGHDQVDVTGTVTIGNSVTLSPDFTDFPTPSNGDSWVIVNNDGTDAVTGTFDGLAEGATVTTVNGLDVTISYIGGDGNDVVLTASAPPPGAALDLDGVNDYVDFGTLPALENQSQVTWQAWVKLKDLGAAQAIIEANDNNSGGTDYFSLETSGDGRKLALWIKNGGTAGTMTTNANELIIGQWVHCTVVFDGTEANQDDRLKFYINGSLVVASRSNNIPTTTASSIGDVILGSQYGTGQFADAQYDEVRFWNRVLCPAEISNNYNCELLNPAGQTGLVGYYDFNEGIAGGNNTSPAVTTLPDLSGNSNDGALNNFALTGATSNWVEPGAVTSGVSCPAFAIANFDPTTCGCLPGYFPTYDVNNNITACNECPAGSFCDGFSSNPCPAGTFQDATGQSFCKPCEAGKFSAGTGAVACDDCPAGRYNPFTGAVQCQDCPTGTFTATTGNVVCETCEPGSTAANTGQQVCDNCIPPSFSDCPTVAAVDNINGTCEANVTVPTPTLSNLCTRNHALDFDGVDDYVSIPFLFNPASTPFTVEAWVLNASTGGTDQVVVQQTDGSGTGRTLLGVRSTGRVYSVLGNLPTEGGTNLALNTWYHLALSYDGATLRLFVNGVEDAVSSRTAGSTVGGLRLGTDKNGNFSWQGAIDEVRIWNVARTETEIQAAKDLEINSTYPGLIAYYDFNEGVACCDNTGLTTLPDQSGNTNDGTLNNFDLSGACPSNWTAGAPALGDPLTLVNDVTGTCDASGTYLVGNTTITWTATGANGSTANCTQTVTVQDTSRPVITCGADIVVDNNVGTCEASVTVPAPQVDDLCDTLQFGNALDFGGANDDVTVGNFDVMTGTAYTVEGWIKTSFNLDENFISLVDGSGTYFSMDVRPTTGFLRYVHRPNGGTAGGVGIQSTSTVNDGGWHHFAVVSEGAGGNVLLYLDGVQEGSIVSSGGNLAAGSATSTLYLGSLGGVRTFSGQMDEIRVWNVARSATEIDAARNSSLTGSEPGLVALYDFNQGTPNGDNGSGCPSGAPCVDTLIDLTGNYQGDLTGFALSGSSSNWVNGALVIKPNTLTNDYNNTSDASDTYPVGVTTVTWTATDAAGNTATCTQTVTVQDTSAPNLLCQDTVIFLDASGTVSLAAGGILFQYPEYLLYASDLSGFVPLGACGNTRIGSTAAVETFTWDDQLASADGVDSITLEVTMQFSPNNNTYPYSLNGNVLGQEFGVGTGACSRIVQTFNLDLNAYQFGGSNVFTWDLPENVHAFITNPNWEDAYARVVIHGKSVSDNCSPENEILLVSSMTAFDCGDAGANTVTLTATDTSGNTATCTQTVTVQDTSAPTAVCNDITIQLDASGNYTLTQANVDDIGQGSSDNCTDAGDLTLNVSPNMLDCDNIVLGQPNDYAVELDGINDFIQSQATNVLKVLPLTVEAWVKPELRSESTSFYPNNVLSNDNPGQFGHGFGANVNATVNQITVQYENGFRQINSAGLSTSDWQHIAVVYTSGNVKTYLNGVEIDDFNYTQGVPLNGTGSFWIGKHNDDTNYGTRRFYKGQVDEVRVWHRALSQTEIMDNMNTTVLGNETDLQLYYTFEDGPGSSTVTDILGNADADFQADMDPNTDWVSPGSPVTPAVAGTPITLTVTDEAGNPATCTASVTVLDVTPPTLTGIPADESVDCNAVPAAPTISVSDNCDNGLSAELTEVHSDGPIPISGLLGLWSFNEGSGLTAEDAFGISDGVLNSASINWVPGHRQGTALQFPGTSPAYVEIPNGTDGRLDTKDAISMFAWIIPGTNGDAQMPIIQYNPDAFGAHLWQTGPTELFVRFTERGSLTFAPDLSDNGLQPGEWNLVGATYDKSTGDQALYINGVQVATGNINPPIDLATDYPVRIGGVDFDSRKTDAQVDNAMIWGRALTPAEVAAMYDAACPDDYTLNRFWSAVDASENAAFGSQVITVEDTEDPVFTSCPTTVTEVAGAGTCQAAVSFSATATDNCTGSPSISYSIAPGSSFPVGSTPVIATATDDCGRSSTCTISVVVTDGEAPEITCGADVAVDNIVGTCEASVTAPAPTVTDNCGVNNALNFDGMNDYVSTPFLFNPAITPFTVEAWVWKGSIGGVDQVVVQQTNGSGFGRTILGVRSSGRVFSVLGTFPTEGSTILNPNTWYHLALSYDGTTLRLFVNGVEDAAQTRTMQSADGGLRLGTDKNGNFSWEGSMDEVRIWNVARSQADIQNNYTKELSGSETGLVAYYNFNQGDACMDNTGLDTLIDQAGNNNGDLENFDLTTTGANCSSNWTGGVFPTAVNDRNGGTAIIDEVFALGAHTVVWTATDAAGNTATCTQTVTVNDTTAPQIIISDVTVCEGASGTTDMTFTIESVKPLCQPIEVDIETNGVTATEGVDYELLPFVLTQPLVFGGFTTSRSGSTGLANGSSMNDLRTLLTDSLPSPIFTENDVLTPAYLSTLDVLVISNWPSAVILSQVEQDAMLEFVENGGALLSFQENGGWTGNAQAANASFVDVFGMQMTLTNCGGASNTVTITNPSAHPVTDGYFGVISSFPVICPGWYTSLGPDAICLGTHAAGCGIAVIDPDALAPGSGGVLLIPDGNGATAAGLTDVSRILLNAIANGLSNRIPFAGTANEQQTITVEVQSDMVSEGDETFELIAKIDGNTVAIGTGTILNDDCSITGSNSVDASALDQPYSGPAGMTSYSWSITSGDATLDANSGQNVTVDVGCQDFTIQLEGVDANNCDFSCSLDVSVTDVTPPTANCQDITINLESPGSYTLDPSEINNNSSDNCGTPTLSIPTTTFDCDDVGMTIDVVLTVTDGVGLTDACTAQVTVADGSSFCNQPPVANCQDITVNADANCQGTAAATEFDNNSTDPDNDPLTFSVSPVGPYVLGPTDITLTVTDDDNASATCTATVTVEDVTPPDITCAADITVDNIAGTCEANVTVPQPTVDDNCPTEAPVMTTNTVTIEAWIFPEGTQDGADGIVFTRGGIPATGLNIGFPDPSKIGYHWNGQSNTWNWAGGPTYISNTWNHVALVIEPTKATIYLNGANAAVNNVSHPELDLNQLWRIASDPCCGGRYFDGSIDEVRIWGYARTQGEIMSTMNTELTGSEAGLLAYFNLNQGSAGNSNPGLTTAVASKGTDGSLIGFGLSGSSSNWVAGQTGFGNSLNFDGANDEVTFSLTTSATLLTLTNNFNGTSDASGTYSVGETTITWTATDDAGNTATCTQTVTVQDTSRPVITLLGNSPQIHCIGTTYTDAGAEATDNCDGNLTGSISTNNPVDENTAGMYTVTYDVMDAAGNDATQVTRTVQVVDPQATPSASSDMFCSPGSSGITVGLNGDADAFNVSLNVTSGAIDGGAPADRTNQADGALLEPATLENTGNVDAVIEYTITPYHYGQDGENDNGAGDDCTGPSQTVTITVQPEPVGADLDFDVCDGTLLNIDLQAIVDTAGNALPSDFTWVAASNPDVTGENTISQSGTIINNQLALVDPSGGPVTVTYTVSPTGLNGCPGEDFTITVTVQACEVEIIDPCTCLDNATTQSNGQFSELIEVTGPDGDTWEVVSAPGLYLSTSPAPPAAPTPVPAGTPLPEGPDGTYTLTGRHIDAQGYTIVVTNGDVQLSVSNVCYYPNVSFTNARERYCVNSGENTIGVEAQLGAGGGAAPLEQVVFTLLDSEGNVVDTETVTAPDAAEYTFDPADFGQGTYTLRAEFDADDAGTSEPGCIQPIETSFRIQNVGCGSFPWDGGE